MQSLKYIKLEDIPADLDMQSEIITTSLEKSYIIKTGDLPPLARSSDDNIKIINKPDEKIIINKSVIEADENEKDIDSEIDDLF